MGDRDRDLSIVIPTFQFLFGVLLSVYSCRAALTVGLCSQGRSSSGSDHYFSRLVFLGAMATLPLSTMPAVPPTSAFPEMDSEVL